MQARRGEAESLGLPCIANRLCRAENAGSMCGNCCRASAISEKSGSLGGIRQSLPANDRRSVIAASDFPGLGTAWVCTAIGQQKTLERFRNPSLASGWKGGCESL